MFSKNLWLVKNVNKKINNKVPKKIGNLKAAKGNAKRPTTSVR